jgi:hypothetical protein
MKRWILLLLVAACGSKSAPPTAARCRQMVAHADELDRRHNGGVSADAAWLDRVAKQCEDTFSSELVDCMLAATDQASADACKRFAPKPKPVDVATQAERSVKELAFEAFPTWAMSHPEKECPDRIEELLALANHTTAVDPWGHPFQMYCGPSLPPGAHGLAVVSAGPDGKVGSADDIKSW